MKYILLLLTLSAATCLVGFQMLKANSGRPQQYRTVKVTRGDLVLAVSASGTVEPVEIVDVGAQIVGRIKRFGAAPDDPEKTIDYGTRVEEGTILAQIDEQTFQATVDQAQANMTMAMAERDVASARLEHAENDFSRAEELAKTNSMAKSEYDKFRAAYDSAKAEVAIADARILQAKAELQQAEIDLGYVTIRSPIDGLVIDRRVNVGQTVVAGLNAPSLFLIARDLSRLEIWASVNEADIGMIRVGQDVEFTVDAYPESTFDAKVQQIRLNARMTQNVVTYTVVVGCDNPEGKLLPYMTANLKFEVARRENVLLQTNQALRWRPTLEQVAPEYREDFLAGAFPQATFEVRFDSQQEEAYTPVPGVVWVEAGAGLVRPVLLRVGLTDRLSSELVTDSLSEGTPVVIGEIDVQDEIGDFTSTFVRLPDS